MYKSIRSGITNGTVDLLIFDRNERREKQGSLIVYNSSFRRYLETKRKRLSAHGCSRGWSCKRYKSTRQAMLTPIGAVNQGIAFGAVEGA